MNSAPGRTFFILGIWVLHLVRHILNLRFPFQKLFFNFSSTRFKKRIARSYGVPQHEILESWMKNLCAIRNICAHHGRLWNRVIPVKPIIPSRVRSIWISNTSVSQTRLYAGLCCMLYWLNAIDSNNTFCTRLKGFVEDTSRCWHHSNGISYQLASRTAMALILSLSQ